MVKRMARTPAFSDDSCTRTATILFVEDVLEERVPAIETLRAHGYDVPGEFVIVTGLKKSGD